MTVVIDMTKFSKPANRLVAITDHWPIIIVAFDCSARLYYIATYYYYNIKQRTRRRYRYNTIVMASVVVMWRGGGGADGRWRRTQTAAIRRRRRRRDRRCQRKYNGAKVFGSRGWGGGESVSLVVSQFLLSSLALFFFVSFSVFLAHTHFPDELLILY